MSSNKNKSITLKNNYSSWKKTKLDTSGYFIIFNDFLSPSLLKNISGNALKLYIYLGLHSNNMNGEVWHGVDKISKYFNKSDRTIRTWLRELQDLGLIYRMQLEYNGNSHNYLLPYNSNLTTKNLIQYRLKNSKLRESVDLTDFADSITKGIKSVFPTSKINISKQIFSITLDYKPTSSELRKMGYEIKSRDYRYKNLIKEYSYTTKTGTLKKSTQLFQRIK